MFSVPAPGERKTGTMFGSTTTPAGGAFGNSQNQTQQPSLFGASAANTQQNNNAGGGFGGFGQSQQNNNAGGAFGGGFGQSQQFSQQQQQQQQNNMNVSVMGGLVRAAPSLDPSRVQQLQQQQQALPKLRQSVADKFTNTYIDGTREKSVVEQMKTIVGKWDPNSPECAFQYYFYNSVKPEEAPFYGPQAHEDHKKWEEALANKPSEGSIPLLVRGFEEMAARIQYQVFAMNTLQSRLHEMNNCLGLIKDQHELVTEKRITQAKQKHIEHTQRILALATKVQILRNRGYAMDQTEEELKKKLAELEKKAFDPINGGRQEEIWARMSTVRERAQALQNETERMGNTAASLQDRALLSDDDQVQLEKILKGYDQQLQHLKKMVDDTKQEYEEWEKEQQKPTRSAGRR
ncbi:hypothetical protein GRF29_1g639429 [Pseudopithomyces chartarum]|uniref:Nucleoporin Nup54 alpha-helical domain-containing protein n=1 Tax=Pseudopithomyces chartarum TaxID=1892770 RepID=A0AAN6RKL1_9PLEO|nr:hypothetical protein GRF29_1g639429 [Pseudopithomyces chartarum]